MTAPQSASDDSPQIYIDGDACPVKPEVERVATRHGLKVFIVSNGGIRPGANPLIRVVAVGQGADAADDWLAENITDRDIAITADIPLASRCLKKGARVLGPNGRVFTLESIGMALGMRNLHRHLRELTGEQTRHGSFTRQDKSRFLSALENEIQATKRGLERPDLPPRQ